MVLFVPAVDGVPLMTPLVAIESPAGVLVLLKLIGAPPLAVTVQFVLTPTLPWKEFVEVIWGIKFVSVAVSYIRK
jgi:hypothetical protein